MSHVESLAQTGEPSDCNGELRFYRRGFWDDVNWSLARCGRCNEVIACVEGGAHHWNYTVTNQSILQEADAILGA